MEHVWKIYDLKRIIANGVVTEVNYACESNFSGSSTRKIGDLAITGSSSDEGFIEFDQLTEGIVLSWVTGSSEVDVAAIEAECSASIDENRKIRAAVTKTQGIPW